jgi:hypothetical protein
MAKIRFAKARPARHTVNERILTQNIDGSIWHFRIRKIAYIYASAR